ncbi:MOSC domain-containing protein [Saccharopolyspora sp. K220]|uniref:MOSC domain-containing protein n=1 Tax=Saccharopolyspora soli TaxID=2926618 RepID=UPI001F57ED1D|nr:MOSC domain-containing protein [Saccharopolyspora soli]MCI2417458.1 MOSC domain-containing protein [Saccharopolyspora soli]
MLVESVNIGIARPVAAKSGYTGIDKRPIDGAVLVRAPGPKGCGSGLVGDQICDNKNHGGDDQAVYAYAREDLDRWQDEAGRSMPSGTFGENLTTSGVDVNHAIIGERWRIGAELLLQVTTPRIPCRTFAAWLGLRGWVRTFTRRALPGAYFRVVEPGHVRRGDQIVVAHRPGHGLDVETVFRAFTTSPELLPELVDVEELPAEGRELARRRVCFDLD